MLAIIKHPNTFNITDRLVMHNKVSKESQEQAMKVANSIQKKGQSKAQTKLIAQGIEKGIAEYKKQQSKKSRERDRDRKQEVKKKQRLADEPESSDEPREVNTRHYFPWLLLVLSWIAFIIYTFFK